MKRLKLLNLIKNNLECKGKKFEVQARGDREAVIYLYDIVDNWYGVNSEDFAREIDALDVDVINLHINSPGGDVFDARAMYSALKRHPARVVSHIDGLCASAVTYVAMAADEVRMTDGAFLMIHKGWTTLMGNSDEIRTTADLLDQVDASIANDYHKKTGIEVSQLTEWMGDEKWMNAETAKELGFIDSVFDGDGIENHFDLSVYDKLPEQLKAKAPDPDPQVPPKPVFNARTPLLARLTELHESATV